MRIRVTSQTSSCPPVWSPPWSDRGTTATTSSRVPHHYPVTFKRYKSIFCNFVKRKLIGWYLPEQRDRTNSFSLNRNLCPERERSNTFTQIKSHNYLERVKMRRLQKMVIILFVRSECLCVIWLQRCCLLRHCTAMYCRPRICSMWSRRRRTSKATNLYTKVEEDRSVIFYISCVQQVPKPNCLLSLTSLPDQPRCVETLPQTSPSSMRWPHQASPLFLTSFCWQVLCLGKIKSSHKRAPPTFIDEALTKFKQKQHKREVLGVTTRTDKVPNPATPLHPLDDSKRGQKWKIEA